MDLEDLLDKGWVRFLIHFAFMIAFAALSIWLYNVRGSYGLPNQYSGITIFGFGACIGTLFIFIANDLMREDGSDGGRIFLSVLGGLFIIGAGGFATFGYGTIGLIASKPTDASQLQAASPWIAALGGIHLLGGVIFCIIIYTLLYLDVDNEILYLIAFPAAFALAYILNIPFAFLYQVSGSIFFNGWPVMIISIIGIVVVIVGHFREWERFDFSELRYKLSGVGSSISARRARRKNKPKRERRNKPAKPMKPELKTNENELIENNKNYDRDKTEDNNNDDEGEETPTQNQPTEKLYTSVYSDAIRAALLFAPLPYSGYHTGLTWVNAPYVKTPERHSVSITGMFTCYQRDYAGDTKDDYQTDIEDRCREAAQEIYNIVENTIDTIISSHPVEEDNWRISVTISCRNNKGLTASYCERG